MIHIIMKSKKLVKVVILSLSYNQIGHAREYIDNLYKNLKDSINIEIPISKDTSKTLKEKAYRPLNIKSKTFEDIKYLKFGKIYKVIRKIDEFFYALKFYRKVWKIYRKEKDVIFYFTEYEYFSMILFSLFLKIKNKRFIIWIHSASNKGNLFYRIYKTISLNLIKYIVGKGNRIVVNGELIKNILVNEFKYKENLIKVIQYPSELTKPLPKISKEKARKILGIPTNEKVVLHFGILREDKEIDKIIEAISLSKTKPFLIIAGKEAFYTKEKIKKLLEKYNVKKYKLLIKYLIEEEIHLLYSASDLLLIIYKEGSISQSGPLSLARNYLLPVLASNIGEIGYYVNKYNTGILIDQNSPREIADKIDYFFSKKISFKMDIEKAQKIFSWKNASKVYINLLEEMI